jgi:hypothetical protein
MWIDPPPSVSSATGTSPAATAAALPPEEPPVFREGPKGLRLGPNSGLSQVPRKPMTGLFVLPTMIVPRPLHPLGPNAVESSMKSLRARTPPNVDGQSGL